MGIRGDSVHLETFWGGILSGVTFSGGILSGGGLCPYPVHRVLRHHFPSISVPQICLSRKSVRSTGTSASTSKHGKGKRLYSSGCLLGVSIFLTIYHVYCGCQHVINSNFRFSLTKQYFWHCNWYKMTISRLYPITCYNSIKLWLNYQRTDFHMTYNMYKLY